MSRLTFPVFGAALMLLGCDANPTEAQKSQKLLPAIDQAAPAKVETATLALG